LHLNNFKKMNKSLIFVLIFAFIGLTAVIMYFVYDNKYVTINNLYEAQVKENEVIHDEMWKILQQQAGVTENYAESFADNYERIMNARNYGGEMMKWITESNPTYTSAMHEKLMVSIETYRTKFTMVQRKLISVHNELKNLLTLFPSRIFLVTIGGHVLPELKIVTSSRTGKAFETGKDDDTDLFQKKEKKDTTN
jgi:hypothetical protein